MTNKKRNKMTIEINIEKFSKDFRNHNYTVEKIKEYVGFTGIIPAYKVGQCKHQIVAFTQIKRQNLIELENYVLQGCFYCIGHMPKDFCKMYNPIKN